MILLKEIVGRTLKNIANSLKIFKLDTLGFVVHDFIKVLIAESQLYVEPILRFALFF